MIRRYRLGDETRGDKHWEREENKKIEECEITGDKTEERSKKIGQIFVNM